MPEMWAKTDDTARGAIKQAVPQSGRQPEDDSVAVGPAFSRGAEDVLRLVEHDAAYRPFAVGAIAGAAERVQDRKRTGVEFPGRAEICRAACQSRSENIARRVEREPPHGIGAVGAIRLRTEAVKDAVFR